jgi:hypothetical protein
VRQNASGGRASRPPLASGKSVRVSWPWSIWLLGSVALVAAGFLTPLVPRLRALPWLFAVCGAGFLALSVRSLLATTQRLGVLQTARLFAMVDMTVADAQIACNIDKERWNQWRPISAIREADTDGNPRTVADPEWTPLLVTPPNPDYPSGANCNEGARGIAYTSFFGRDNIAFSGFSVDGGTRRYFRSFPRRPRTSPRHESGVAYTCAPATSTAPGSARPSPAT